MVRSAKAAAVVERGALTRSPARLVVWFPLLVAGVVATAVATRGRKLRQWFDSVHSAGQLQALLGPSPRRFEMLRQAVLGNEMPSVKSVFGQPPTTASVSAGAETWYYPIDPVEQYAMVVTFRGGVAHQVNFIQAPQAWY
jgi:hypothetical protein